jgi:putative thymidine phosphorylase
MAFSLSAKRLDFSTGDQSVVVLQRGEARRFGVAAGGVVQLHWRAGNRDRHLVVTAQVTQHKVKPGQLGLFREAARATRLKTGDTVTVELISRPPSIEAITKKLKGGTLTPAEIKTIVRDIVDRRLGPIEITYFMASSFVKPYSIPELIALTRAMAETGEQLRLPGRRMVVDKHSVGGLAGNRTTMLVVPMVASLGLTIPKTSSRAITSPAGTADTMEVLAPVQFTLPEIRRLVNRTNACIIWGGGLAIAPADDLIIRVSRPLSFEPYDKMIVSILAKKVAMGVKALVIDMPVGPSAKVSDFAIAKVLASKFETVARPFGIKVKVIPTAAREPVGQGIGPVLEARDVLRVLQQRETRPRDLEAKAIRLAGELLELAGRARRGKGAALAHRTLKSQQAWKKMQEIIHAQGGNPSIDADDLPVSRVKARIVADRDGTVTSVDNHAIDHIAKTLGAPEAKTAGIYLHRRIGSVVERGQKLFTLYAPNRERLNLALAAVPHVRIFSIR